MTDSAVSQSPAPGGSTPAVETNGVPKVSPFTLLVGMVIRPVETFKQLREAKRGYWWFVLLVTVVLIAVLALAESSAQMRAVQSFMTTEEGGKPGVIVSGQGGQTAGPSSSNGADFQQIQTGVSVAMIALPLIGGTVVTLLDYLLRALVVFLMSMLLGGKAAFKDTFRMAAWTTIPAAIRRVIQAVAVVVTGGTVAAGFSAVLTTAELATRPLVATLLSYLDFYTLWSMLLLGIGAAVTGKLSKGKAAFSVAIYVGISLVGILVFYAITTAITSAIVGPGGPAGGGPRGGRAGG